MLAALLAPQADRAYIVLRVVSGLLFSVHGMQKIFGVLGGHQPEVGTQLWIGGMIELLGGLAIAAGVGTRLAAFLCSGTMAVAYADFHWHYKFDENFFPVVNGGELAAVYAFVFLYIACRGNGTKRAES